MGFCDSIIMAIRYLFILGFYPVCTLDSALAFASALSSPSPLPPTLTDAVALAFTDMLISLFIVSSGISGCDWFGDPDVGCVPPIVV